MCVNEIVLTVK